MNELLSTSSSSTINESDKLVPLIYNSTKIARKKGYGKILELEGACFHVERTHQTLTAFKYYWQCTYRNPQCKARVHTVEGENGHEIVKYTGLESHFHEVDGKEAFLKRAKHELHTLASQTKESSSVVVDTIFDSVPPSIQGLLPSKASLQRNVTRIRKNAKKVLNDLKNLNNINDDLNLQIQELFNNICNADDNILDENSVQANVKREINEEDQNYQQNNLCFPGTMKSTWFLAIEDEIKDAKIVLASQSPNRLKLLKELGIDPEVVVSGFEENLPKSLHPTEFVQETAAGKALEVSTRLNKDNKYYDVIIACDTVVVIDDEIIGKPKDEEDALTILKKLNNRWHSVFSGVVLVDKKQNMEKFNVETKVKFGNIPLPVIREYIKTGECMNRAGAYGIQHRASAFVESINGCYFNIVGLPIYETVKRMRKLLLHK